MAWETLTWWLRHREPPKPTAPAPHRVTEARIRDEVAAWVATLHDALAKGAGGAPEGHPGAERLIRWAESRPDPVVEALVGAWERWPRCGVGDPRLAAGGPVLARVLDRSLVEAGPVDPTLLERVARRAAAERPSLAPMEGLITAIERCVERGQAGPDLKAAVEELRHGLPLEARGPRRRLQHLLGHWGPDGRG